MHCPTCGNELKQVVTGGVTVDVCDGGCGGIWFDRFELQKFDEPFEDAATLLLSIEKDDSIQIDHNLRRYCPKCEDVVMMRHFFSPKREIQVDECPQCGGYWLDAGELASLRAQYPSEADRRRAAEEYFNEVFGDRLEELRAQSEGALARARRIARIFRHICPSYYVPGKQQWGAF
jgi:Zn-finger nucleic acid-binding protein